MFEKCGIMDVFSALWKHKWLLLAVAAVFAATGLGLGLVKESRQSSLPAPDNNAIWVASASYSVTDTSGLPEFSGDTEFSRDGQKAKSLLSVADADHKRAKILKGLLEKYTPAEITEGLRLDVSADQLTFYALLDVVNGSVPEGTNIIHVFLTGKNEALVADYMELVKVNFQESAEEIGHCEARYIDGTVGVRLEENEAGLIPRVSPVPQGILFGILGFVLGVLALASKAIFWPTLNRRSDFAPYGLSVLGEARVTKEEK